MASVPLHRQNMAKARRSIIIENQISNLSLIKVRSISSDISFVENNFLGNQSSKSMHYQAQKVLYAVFC